jgi:hypothetical protein
VKHKNHKSADAYTDKETTKLGMTPVKGWKAVGASVVASRLKDRVVGKSDNKKTYA